MAKKCPMCGASLKAGDVQCQYCGTDVTTKTSTTQTTATYSETDTTFDSTEASTTNTTFTRPKSSQKPFNLGLFIILFIFVPYVAIIYALAYYIDMTKNKK